MVHIDVQIVRDNFVENRVNSPDIAFDVVGNLFNFNHMRGVCHLTRTWASTSVD